MFSLSCEEEHASQSPSYKIVAVPFHDDSYSNSNGSSSSNVTGSHITATLNPLRPPEVLSDDIFELLCSQMKYIAALPHKQLIESVSRTMMNGAPPIPVEDMPGQSQVDYGRILWGEGEGDGGDDREDRGRSRSPGRSKVAEAKDRKQAYRCGTVREILFSIYKIYRSNYDGNDFIIVVAFSPPHCNLLTYLDKSISICFDGTVSAVSVAPPYQQMQTRLLARLLKWRRLLLPLVVSVAPDLLV